MHSYALVGTRGRVCGPRGGLSRRFGDRRVRGGLFFGRWGGAGRRPGVETATREGGLVAVNGTRCVHCGPSPSKQRGFTLTDSGDLDSRAHKSTVTSREIESIQL